MLPTRVADNAGVPVRFWDFSGISPEPGNHGVGSDCYILMEEHRKASQWRGRGLGA